MDHSHPSPRSESDARPGAARQEGSVGECERSAWRLALLQAELRGIENGFITAARLQQF